MPELLALVRSYLDIEVVLVVTAGSPPLTDDPHAGAPPVSAARPEPAIVHDPDGTRLQALTRTSAHTGSTVALPVPELAGTLVLRARHDVTRDLRPTAELVAELLVQTVGRQASVADQMAGHRRPADGSRVTGSSRNDSGRKDSGRNDGGRNGSGPNDSGAAATGGPTGDGARGGRLTHG